MQVLSSIGWMAALTAVTWFINKGIEAYDNYVHRLDNAKEALSQTQSELSGLNSQLDETNRRIKELESKGPLSLTDKADLDQLRLQNEELKFRQQYLDMQEQADKETVAKTAKDKYRTNYGISGDTSQPTPDDLSYVTSVEYAFAGTPLYQDSLELNSLLRQYDKTAEKLKNASNKDDEKGVEKYSLKPEKILNSLREKSTELQGLKDDMETAGGSSKELNNISKRLRSVDTRVLAPEEGLHDFLDTDGIFNSKKELVAIATSGQLTADSLKANFSEVDDYIKANGISFERFIQILKSQVPEVSFGIEDQNPDPFQLQSVQSNLNSQSLLSTAMKELSGSGTLTQATFNSLKSSFSDIDSILTQTASGVEVNRQDERVK